MVASAEDNQTALSDLENEIIARTLLNVANQGDSVCYVDAERERRVPQKSSRVGGDPNSFSIVRMVEQRRGSCPAAPSATYRYSDTATGASRYQYTHRPRIVVDAHAEQLNNISIATARAQDRDDKLLGVAHKKAQQRQEAESSGGRQKLGRRSNIVGPLDSPLPPLDTGDQCVFENMNPYKRKTPYTSRSSTSPKTPLLRRGKSERQESGDESSNSSSNNDDNARIISDKSKRFVQMFSSSSSYETEEMVYHISGKTSHVAPTKNKRALRPYHKTSKKSARLRPSAAGATANANGQVNRDSLPSAKNRNKLRPLTSTHSRIQQANEDHFHQAPSSSISNLLDSPDGDL